MGNLSIKYISHHTHFSQIGPYVIYGCGTQGRKILTQILHSDETVPNCIVDSTSNSLLCGHQVSIYDEAKQSLIKNIAIVLCVPTTEIGAVIEKCRADGFYNFYRVDWINRFNIVGEEWYMEDLFFRTAKKCKEKMMALDIGANRGPMTLRWAPEADFVHCFEPNTLITDEFIHNCAHLDNIALHKVAFASEKGQGTLNIDTETTGGSSLSRELSVHHDTLNVDITTLDHFCIENKIEPDFIKIDAEGMDGFIILGGQKVIQKYKPFILFEFVVEEWKHGFEECFKFLQQDYALRFVDANFDIIIYVEEVFDRLPKVDARNILDCQHRNVACIPKEYLGRETADHNGLHIFTL